MGDERISCQFIITVKSVSFEDYCADQSERGPIAIQILRGPLRSETKEIDFPEGPTVLPIDLVFSRLTTMYRLSEGTFQRKIALIRLLQLATSTEEASMSPVRGGCSLAKVLAEI